MKKLTAGILTVLLGIVSANSADAAVASKGYVDAKAAAEANAAKNAAASALAGAKEELEGKIDLKVAQTDYDAKVAALEAADATFATKDSMTTELSKKQNNLTVTGGVLTWDAATSTLGLTGIATDSSVSTLQNTVNRLDGDANTDGSVKKQIAAAIAGEIERSNAAYATAAQGALADSAVQFDDVATADKTGVVKSGTSVSVAADGTMGVVFGDIASANETLPVTGKAIVDYVGNTITNDVLTEVSDVADTAKAADTLSKSNKTAIDAINNEQTGILKQAQNYADQAESDAVDAAKTETERQITELALKAISKVPAECSAMDKYCALTYGTDGYVWEVIERATGEELATDERTVTGIKPTAGN
ncbi:MAG: hypothetical protein R8M37_00300 [Alphaproteobacteria bacterium]|nr:hypothetical protein [Alphaproteobacteria bacterium]